jgi:hypothetical protein
MIVNILQYIGAALVIMAGAYHFVNTCKTVWRITGQGLGEPHWWLAMTMHWLVSAGIVALGIWWWYSI